MLIFFLLYFSLFFSRSSKELSLFFSFFFFRIPFHVFKINDWAGQTEREREKLSYVRGV